MEPAIASKHEFTRLESCGTMIHGGVGTIANLVFKHRIPDRQMAAPQAHGKAKAAIDRAQAPDGEGHRCRRANDARPLPGSVGP